MNRLLELFVVVAILALAWYALPAVVALIVTILVLLGAAGYLRGR